jgi:biopolymer transport protein TolR
MIELPKRHRPTVDANINIVPYIDVMLVLLVIFMMTTPIIEQGIEIDLPIADSKMIDFIEQQDQQQGPTVTTIFINEDGDYFISSLDENNPDITEDEKLSPKAIAVRVSVLLEMYPTMKVLVRGSKNIDYKSIIELISLLQENGVDKVGLVTEPPKTN